jgi:hypothetical protein
MFTCTEDHTVDLGLYGMIWKLAAAGFCIRPMWRYSSTFVPRAVPPDRMLTAQIKRAKKHG